MNQIILNQRELQRLNTIPITKRPKHINKFSGRMVIVDDKGIVQMTMIGHRGNILGYCHVYDDVITGRLLQVFLFNKNGQRKFYYEGRRP